MNTGARQQELRLELLLLEARLLGRRMLGHPPRPTRPHLRRMSGDLPQPTAPDLWLLQRPRMAGRAMATAQGRIRILRSSTLPREDGAEPNRTVINFAGRHSLSTSPDHAGASEVPDSPHRRAASALVHRGFAAEKFSIGVPI